MFTFNTGSGIDWGIGTDVGMGMVFIVAPLDCTGGGSTDLREILDLLAALKILTVHIDVMLLLGLKNMFLDS